jgi:protein phosphatase
LGTTGVNGYDQIEYASLTDQGIRRPQNEDYQAVALAVDAEQWQRQGHLFLVADGMGGHAVGELASELAAGIIPHTYHKYAPEGAGAALRKAFLEANASIHARGQQNLDFKGMGTTSTVLVLGPCGAWVGHVGDSRAYRVRDGRIEQLTFDHSWVWELARRQNVSPDSLKGVASNFINRSLGPDPLVQVDVEGPHPLREGDTFIVCSDGLSNQLTDVELGAVAGVLPPAEACPLLVGLANLRGGPDNVTVIVARVKGNTPPGAAAPVTQPPGSRPAWYQGLSWQLVALVAGVALAAQAIVLGSSGGSDLGKWVFVLAALAILSGLAGFLSNYVRDRRKAGRISEDGPLHVYRQASCRVERQLVDRLASAEAALARWARGKGALADGTANRQHRELAETALRQGDLVGAFREYCRAVRPLTDFLLRDRKDEGLQTVWERTTG